jgi:hypothetical protein
MRITGRILLPLVGGLLPLLVRNAVALALNGERFPHILGAWNEMEMFVMTALPFVFSSYIMFEIDLDGQKITQSALRIRRCGVLIGTVVGAALICLAHGTIWASFFGPGRASSTSPIAVGLAPIWAALLIVLGYAIGCWLSRNRSFHSEYPPFCRKCGYSLRGLPEARCPECGTEFPSDRVTDGAGEIAGK